jgi:hypothetical protein
MDERKNCVFFVQKYSLHIIGQDQSAQKGEKINNDAQTKGLHKLKF